MTRIDKPIHDPSLCADCEKPLEADYGPGNTETYHFCRWCEPNCHFCDACQKKIDESFNTTPKACDFI